MQELSNGWRQCRAGELDRLERRLKSERQQKTWGNALAIFALSVIIAFCSWQTASAIWPDMGDTSAHASGSCPVVGARHDTPPNDCAIPCSPVPHHQ